MTITIEPKEIAELAKLFTSQSRLNDVYYSFCRVCEQLFDEEARNKPPEFQRRKLVFSSNGDFIEGGSAVNNHGKDFRPLESVAPCREDSIPCSM